MRKILNSVKKFLASPKTRAVALMLLVGGTAAFAQSTAGDYTAGTNALTTVAEEIAKYVPIVERTAREHGIAFQAIHIASREDAQSAPTPITTYALFYNGEYLTNEQMNEARFLKLVSQRS